jgi:RNA polymerase sigma-70 factor (ECF subfamily)
MEEIIERYKGTVYGIALSQTRNAADAEDIFQDVFLIYFKKQKQFKEEAHRKAWLIRTTLNRCKKSQSSVWRKRSECHEDTAVAGSWQFELERENDIFAAMSQLPAIYRNVLHLYYFEDLPIAQIEPLLKTKQSTLRVQLKRAREMMRELLKEDYFHEK